jgi:hypothetical protein
MKETHGVAWVVIAATCVFGCTSEPSPLDASVDAGPEGVCCPMEEPSCDCTALGGWAPRVEECDTFGVCDAWPPDFQARVDSHGCPYWVTGSFGSETGCCLCRPEDAGLDAGEDAGEDAGVEVDAGEDAGVDAGVDAGLDADGGPDGGADGG